MTQQQSTDDVMTLAQMQVTLESLAKTMERLAELLSKTQDMAIERGEKLIVANIEIVALKQLLLKLQSQELGDGAGAAQAAPSLPGAQA